MFNVQKYGCSFGAKLRFLYSEKSFNIQRNIFLFRGKFYYIQRNIFIFRGSFIFSEFLCISKKIYYVQWIFCYIQIKVSYSEKTLYLKKLFIFRENFYIQRKCWYSEKMCIFRENDEFKFQIVWVVGFW